MKILSDIKPGIMKMIMLIALLATLLGSALAGSRCPPREDIYPCSCLAYPQGKRLFFTAVTCHRLPNTDALANLYPALRTMAIDHFYLYDSFWEGHKDENNGVDKQVLPVDWLATMKIKEIEIVDTTLSSGFACNSRTSCRNEITTRFTAVNSSSHEKICTDWGDKSGKKVSWTDCMKKLKEFHFRHGKLTAIEADLFPMPMIQLIELDLSYNAISKVQANAFKNLPKLKILNLSHNSLGSLESFASVTLLELQELDVSWNYLSSWCPEFFSYFPTMKTIIANNNHLAKLKERDFTGPPATLRNIDLVENPIVCDCNIRWINTTFHINAVIQGHCVSPDEYKNSLIRRASIMLNQRCTEDGKIGTRKHTTKAPVTEAMNEPL